MMENNEIKIILSERGEHLVFSNKYRFIRNAEPAHGRNAEVFK